MKLFSAKILFIFISLLAGFASICSNIALYFNFPFVWIFAILGIAYLVFLILLIICILYWVWQKSNWWIFCLLCIIFSINQLFVVIAPRFNSGNQSFKPEGTIRILCWNVNRLDEPNKELRGGVSYRPLMLDFIESTGADILCFQEFFECNDSVLFKTNIPEFRKRGYQYHSFFPSSQLFDGKLQSGLSIFSKFPIKHSFYFENSKGIHSEGLQFADIDVGDTIVRVFNLHLESPGISKRDYTAQGEMKISRNVFSKIKNSYYLRNIQAEGAFDEIKRSPYPVIICGDLGDIPNSYAYFKLRGKCKDAFLKKGSGLGRTLRHTSPTLRIDYIFTSSVFQIFQFINVNQIKYSDHYPLISDLKVHIKPTK